MVSRGRCAPALCFHQGGPLQANHTLAPCSYHSLRPVYTQSLLFTLAKGHVAALKHAVSASPSISFTYKNSEHFSPPQPPGQRLWLPREVGPGVMGAGESQGELRWPCGLSGQRLTFGSCWGRWVKGLRTESQWTTTKRTGASHHALDTLSGPRPHHQYDGNCILRGPCSKQLPREIISKD